MRVSAFDNECVICLSVWIKEVMGVLHASLYSKSLAGDLKDQAGPRGMGDRRTLCLSNHVIE